MEELNKPVDFKRWSLLASTDDEEPVQDFVRAPEVNAETDINFKHPNLSRNYRSESLSLMRIDDVVVSKSSNLTDFKLTVKETGSHYVVEIEIIHAYIDNSIEELNDFNQLLYKIASVKNRMELKLDRDGVIVDVLNKGELRDRWLAVKAELQLDRKFLLFKPEERAIILKGGDDEYLMDFDLVGFLNKGYTIYGILFIGYWQDFQLKKTYPLKRKIKNSTLFKDQLIPLDFEVKVKRNYVETGVSELELQGIEPEDLDTAGLKAMYKEIYPFAKVEFSDYSYDYEANYAIEHPTGLIKKMNATVFEKAGSIEMFMDCTIKELRDEKSDITE